MQYPGLRGAPDNAKRLCVQVTILLRKQTKHERNNDLPYHLTVKCVQLFKNGWSDFGSPELRSCVKIEVAVLGSPSLVVRKATPNIKAIHCQSSGAV